MFTFIFLDNKAFDVYRGGKLNADFYLKRLAFWVFWIHFITVLPK